MEFDPDKLKLPNGAETVAYKRLINKRMGIVSTQWKDSKTLQTGSTVMKKGAHTTLYRNDSTLVDEMCPSDIIMQQNNTDEAYSQTSTPRYCCQLCHCCPFFF